MLKQRVITALILFLVFVISVLSSQPWPFTLLTLLLIGAGAWEWARLNGTTTAAMWAVVLGVITACVGLAKRWGFPLLDRAEDAHDHALPHVHEIGASLAGFVVPSAAWWAAAVLWVVGGGMVLRWGLSRWSQWAGFMRLLLGAFCLVMAWLALMEAKHHGINMMLSVMALVWAADIGAYFAGRAWGKRKLAVHISPGKSLEGACAGAVATLLLAGLWLLVDQTWALDSPSLYTHLAHGLGHAGMALAVTGLAAMSVVGDLVESLVKRVAGVKDSSGLLPGHGGVLDRVDALLPVLPLAMAVLSLCHG